jgi:hypothetical protein
MHPVIASLGGKKSRRVSMELAFEIVHVITATQLIDSESYQRSLGAMHAGRLRPGFYVVSWASTGAALRYDDSADFIGPFETRRSAELAYMTTTDDGGRRLGEMAVDWPLVIVGILEYAIALVFLPTSLFAKPQAQGPQVASLDSLWMLGESKMRGLLSSLLLGAFIVSFATLSHAATPFDPQAFAAAQATGKPVLVEVFTDWSGWRPTAWA